MSQSASSVDVSKQFDQYPKFSRLVELIKANTAADNSSLESFQSLEQVLSTNYPTFIFTTHIKINIRKEILIINFGGLFEFELPLTNSHY